MAKDKKKVDLSTEAAIKKHFGKVISTGTELREKKKDYKTLSVSPNLDLALNGGLLEGTWTIISGNPKTGKASSVNSIVYTPDGPKRMGDIVVGDMVCTPDGTTAKVTEVHPQGVRDVYELTFSDDSTAECDINHLWKVKRNYRNKFDWEILRLSEIIDEGLHYSDRPKWSIPLTEPVFFNKKEQSIPPYILGCLIGDGAISDKTPRFITADQELVDVFSEYASRINLNFRSISGYNYVLSHPDNEQGDNKLTNMLRDLNLLGKNSHTKFIPEEYLYGSISQRFQLIRGLMDTDGYNDKGKTAEYTTVSKQLARDVVEVLQSLGYTGKIKKRTTKCNGKEFPSYRIHISGNNISQLFNLSRKKYNTKRIKPKLTRTIKKIKWLRKDECQCIVIDHPDHLYLTDNFIVTHNSTTCLQVCKNAQDEGRNVIYLDAESRLKDYNLIGVDGLNLDDFQIVHGEEDGDALSAEDFLKIAESMFKMPKNKGAVCVIDSCSSLVPRAELEEDPSASLRASLPKLLSHWVKKNAHVVTQNRIIVLIITHYITNTSGYGKIKIPDCGVMVQYQADTRLDISRIEDWDEDGKKIGQKVIWSIGCSSKGASGTEAQSYIRYGTGIDKVQEMIELAELFGIIEKGGSWYKVDFLENQLEFKEAPKYQGQTKLYNFISSREDVYKLMLEKIREVFV